MAKQAAWIMAMPAIPRRGKLCIEGKRLHSLYGRAGQATWFSGYATDPGCAGRELCTRQSSLGAVGRSDGGLAANSSAPVRTLILREDGWARLRPRVEHGQVITRQFVFEGDSLRLNADCRGGYLQVEVLDPSFKPYEGFSMAECLPVAAGDGSQIWHDIVWQGQNGERADLRSLWNKPCRLSALNCTKLRSMPFNLLRGETINLRFHVIQGQREPHPSPPQIS